MASLALLIPIALLFSGVAIAALFWAIRSGQFDDLDRAANDILFDDEPSHPPDPDLSPTEHSADAGGDRQNKDNPDESH